MNSCKKMDFTILKDGTTEKDVPFMPRPAFKNPMVEGRNKTADNNKDSTNTLIILNRSEQYPLIPVL